ncbi:hypothetical protein [Luteimonas panaciterrae]|uniref:hypothetical protein n=1 Tax=Luteimonas panaciterrae TaxID=363885 RepID=UPI001CFBC50E|nr:hypothetical protein [Luteimonas panaciterrae]
MTAADKVNASEWLACIYATRREGPYIVTFAENYVEMDALRTRAVRVLPGDCGITQPALVVWYRPCWSEEAAVSLVNEINHLTWPMCHWTEKAGLSTGANDVHKLVRVVSSPFILSP